MSLYTISRKVENLGVGHVSVDPIPSFICRVFNECQNMLLCCTVSQAASISLWFIQVTEVTEVTVLSVHYTDRVLNHRTANTQDFPTGLSDYISFLKCKQKVRFNLDITRNNKKYLMTSFMSLTGFFDFLADSTGMGIISGGGTSAARSSSPKMAACWV